MDATDLRPFVEALASLAVEAFGVNNQLITWLYATPAGEIYGVTLEDQSTTAPLELGEDAMLGIRVADGETGAQFLFRDERFYALSFDVITGKSHGWWAVLDAGAITEVIDLAVRQSEAYKGERDERPQPSCEAPTAVQ